MIISGEIKNIYEWYAKAGPKNRETQWKKNHSALEFAKLVLDNSFENEKIAICFEAKVNEDFDVNLSKKWEEGSKKNSNIQNRIKNIIDSLWQKSQIENYNDLKYQLLTGLFGTIKFAEKLNIKKCIFCIYQIQVDEKTKVKKTLANK